MCFSSSRPPPQDNSAAIARQEAREREGKIREGQGRIDSAFGIFDPSYYDQFRQSYTDYYNPQVDKQFGDAKQKLTYNLARSGTLDATAGQKQFGDLIDSYATQREQVASKANEATNALRGQVESNKSDLYAQNTASADPSLAAIRAAGRAGSLQSPMSYSPLGDLFSGLVNSGASYLAGREKGIPSGYRNLLSPGGGVSSGGVRVVS